MRYKEVIISHFPRPMLFIGNRNVNVSFTLSGVCNRRKLLVNQLKWWPDCRLRDSMQQKLQAKNQQGRSGAFTTPKPTKTVLATRLLRHSSEMNFPFGKMFLIISNFSTALFSLTFYDYYLCDDKRKKHEKEVHCRVPQGILQTLVWCF